MTCVYCFSATGRSLRVAEYIAKALGTQAQDLCRTNSTAIMCETAVVVFPVYCQNIPVPVRAILPKLQAKRFALIAAYGGMGHGNVLWEATNLICGPVVAAAYVQVGHTYLREQLPLQEDALDKLVDRIQNPCAVEIPKTGKVWFADILPGFRSRVSVRLRKTRQCCECGLCSRVCPVGMAEPGVPGKTCIRCLRCVEICPHEGISVSYSGVLRFYLRKKRQKETILYL